MYAIFAFRLIISEMIQHLGQGAAHVLLVNLRYFAGHAAATVSPEDFRKLFQSLHQTVGRFVENHRPGLAGQGIQSSIPTLLLGKETLETESVTRQTT